MKFTDVVENYDYLGNFSRSKRSAQLMPADVATLTHLFSGRVLKRRSQTAQSSVPEVFDKFTDPAFLFAKASVRSRGG